VLNDGVFFRQIFVRTEALKGEGKDVHNYATLALGKICHMDKVTRVRFFLSINHVQCRKIRPRHLRYFGTFLVDPCPNPVAIWNFSFAARSQILKIAVNHIYS
jgi:hypothetical protein